MLHLRGTRAFSDFRLDKILARIRDGCPQITDLFAEYWHFVRIEGELSARDQEVFVRLLEYGPREQRVDPEGELFVVVPRVGTISPWSSKATDIAHCCGLRQLSRIERGTVWYVKTRDFVPLDEAEREFVAGCVHDPMTESACRDFSQIGRLFDQSDPSPLRTIDVVAGGRQALEQANRDLGLALSGDEIGYLAEQFGRIRRDPTDVELMMFAQVNSEHCRHKIFNAQWVIDGHAQPDSLFAMIRGTHRSNPRGTLVAYADNAAVLEGANGERFFPQPASRQYDYVREPIHIVCKVETHNHPTAISPFPGAATGSGGEIRDEGATGTGAKPKAGLTGFAVSNLRLPGAVQPWEGEAQMPARIATPLQIMLEGPIGGASFNNEFGRPNIAGYFRTFEQRVADADGDERRGYHKPIMLAGGLGNIRPQHVEKHALPAGACIVVLGGPAMLIGLGGGAASSVATGTSSEELDYASVQRSNAEMQRRCQEVIDQCWAFGADNPILSIHDIGAGGLSNALPELVHGSGRGGHFQLRDVLNADPGMSPMQIWCNEAQERYVLAVSAERLAEFEEICRRERCLYCVVGSATDEEQLLLEDRYFASRGDPYSRPIDMSMSVLFGKPPKMTRDVSRVSPARTPLRLSDVELEDAIDRVLHLPTVADKTFLITIGDRSVTGLVCRDQMVGPWQVPVADAAVTAAGYTTFAGEAMAVGERTPIALIDAPASGRMAVGEALTNLIAADVRGIEQIKLSANWMAAAGHPGEDANLYATVRAVAVELCPALGIAIPVGKDSMSMKTVWQDQTGRHAVTAPLSLIVSAFAPVADVRRTLTPQLRRDLQPTELLLIDLGAGNNRLGGSALAQVYGQLGDRAPDVEDPQYLRGLFAALRRLVDRRLVLSYHDRSDGGLISTLCEMAFAGRVGLEISLDALAGDPMAVLFNEELGAVIQIRRADREQVMDILAEVALDGFTHPVAQPVDTDIVGVVRAGKVLFERSRTALHRAWSETTWRMQGLRDNPRCADTEYERLLDDTDPGLHASLRFDPGEDVAAPFINRGARPEIAILREQGVNGQVEMAAAFHHAGFRALDVTMTDIIDGRFSLQRVAGLAACGGFSFGDVLGAGEGWAKSILFNPRARDQFAAFFSRSDTFALGVCNGCQMLSNLHELIPGSEHWPRFVRNTSEQFESRLVMVEIVDSPSILFSGMQGSRLPVVVAHGEGRAEFTDDRQLQRLVDGQGVALRYVDNHGAVTEQYPFNPNGSPRGITGLTSADGRVTIMMPHPERLFRTVQYSWAPEQWGEEGPWLRLFRNARAWLK